uniref:ATP synthase subunit a n=1 Tax=Podura aquatica TaxID=50589 RepID=Q6DVG3_9HEXA|nr:ATP synthase F0 subunit 6 [Podura aquatica]AAT69336.1 ATP synthase F0 subunit 6 [Podura aquatica]
MMTNLFSSFDPNSTYFMLSNWLSTFCLFFLMPSSFWLMKGRTAVAFFQPVSILFNEFKSLISNSKHTIMFSALFFIFLFNNFLGLFPYIFTSSSHLVMNLSVAAPMWMSFMLYGWITQMNHMLAHLVPQSTPGPLMPFMVLIETTSNLIRPGTLAVRLTANMIAGHLLMTLLGNQTASSSTAVLIILLIVQVLLITLEGAVAIIQAYVFSILTTLYSSEV